MTTTVAVNGPCLPGAVLDEASLISRLRAADEEAYESLFRQHSGAMMAIARRYLGDTDDAADVVQEAFVSAFRSIGTFAATSRLATWLHRITVNACLMKLRSHKRRHTVRLDFDIASNPSEERLDSHETVDQVRACIDRLPAEYRMVIQLREIEGLDTHTAAARLGTNAGVVKVRLHRARHALRTLLAPKFASTN